MIILGIDPGLERVGYGVIKREGSRLTVIDYGLILTPRVAITERLAQIHREVLALIETHRPDAMATERLVFAANKTTAMDVSKALGVILLASSEKGLEWAEYTPPEVKQGVVGVGSADKKQVEFMVTKLLSLPKPPKPDDVADALAVAICHAMRSRVRI
ncbi:MAG: crossover junction endodeoxyribonuclease RuvC [Armatimonadetes bacterium 55-13]|nr:crossover junction endodeoxyribonuclease RuvC [Armatimonadota bacterium]ODU52134.1 MAG: crossover junction endodeoxyribonuclease RuvC [bacterium SCN 57-13]OJU63347.1 MAG: crossover junction endodeoxyribonuclease RuvC [Armatimonadetes bacterium 55-13]